MATSDMNDKKVIQETAKDRYDRIVKRQYNWKRSTKSKHKCRDKHKILYDFKQTKSR